MGIRRAIRHLRLERARRSTIAELVRTRGGRLWLEVGAGPRRGTDGWTTLDAQEGCDLPWDLEEIGRLFRAAEITGADLVSGYRHDRTKTALLMLADGSEARARAERPQVGGSGLLFRDAPDTVVPVIPVATGAFAEEDRRSHGRR